METLPYLFAALAVLALTSICAEILMLARLTKMEFPSEKLLWWRRGGNDVEAAYLELFPKSSLPLFRRVAFWLVLTLAVAVLLERLLTTVD